MDERLRKWRLILGKSADPAGDVDLDDEMTKMDNTLDALYDADRKGGLGSSSPNVNRWLGDIRRYFPVPVVQVMQKDALERLGLQEMLTEPELLEAVEPDVHLVATLLSLNKVMPKKTKETAREVVRKVVEQLEKKLKMPFQQALEGSLNRGQRNRRPKHKEIDWNKTIRLNLKNYQADLNTIIPEQLLGFGRKGNALKKVILLVDQSGSMASSLVYAGVLAAVMASVRALKTHMVVFDTSVIDLSDQLQDPIELLFAAQLGGGTDINKALTFSEKLIQQPRDTIIVLISDLFEGGNEVELFRRVKTIKSSGAQLIALLALNDQGAPAYDRSNAEKFRSLDVPTFACSPDQFPDLMATAIKGEDLKQWMSRKGIVGG